MAVGWMQAWKQIIIGSFQATREEKTTWLIDRRSSGRLRVCVKYALQMVSHGLKREAIPMPATHLVLRFKNLALVIARPLGIRGMRALITRSIEVGMRLLMQPVKTQWVHTVNALLPEKTITRCRMIPWKREITAPFTLEEVIIPASTAGQASDLLIRNL